MHSRYVEGTRWLLKNTSNSLAQLRLARSSLPPPNKNGSAQLPFLF